MNSSEIMDLLGSVGDGPYVKNVDIVIVIETSENMSRVVDDIKNLDFSVDGFLNYLGLRDRENIKKIRYKLVWFNGTLKRKISSSQFYTVPGEETELRECLSKISTEGTGKADCVPIQALLKAMNSNFCDVGNKIYHIIVVLSNSGVYWESDEEYEKLRELLVNQWCASNRAQKILILFTPNKTPWDEIGLELDNTIRVDTDYTFYNELTIKNVEKNGLHVLSAMLWIGNNYVLEI